MKYYTSQISVTLAEKLKEKGMPIRYEQTDEGVRPMTKYCEIFDWLMEKGVHIRIESDWDTETQIVTKLACSFYIEKVGMRPIYTTSLGTKPQKQR